MFLRIIAAGFQLKDEVEQKWENPQLPIPEQFMDPSYIEGREMTRSMETQTERRDTFCTQLIHCILGN